MAAIHGILFLLAGIPYFCIWTLVVFVLSIVQIPTFVVSVPMLVIFLGVIGGFILSGFLGLFTGAIVLSQGYKLYISWVN